MICLYRLLFLSVLFYSCTSCKAPCPCGWQWSGGHCYQFSKKPATWCYATAACQVAGGYLVKIESKDENNRLKELANAMTKYSVHARNNGFWIGATDLAAEKKWRWVVDGKRLSKFTDWSTRQPDNYHKKEHCAHMTGKNNHYRWNDNRCEVHLHYICESPSYGHKPCTCIKK